MSVGSGRAGDFFGGREGNLPRGDIRERAGQSPALESHVLSVHQVRIVHFDFGVDQQALHKDLEQPFAPFAGDGALHDVLDRFPFLDVGRQYSGHMGQQRALAFFEVLHGIGRGQPGVHRGAEDGLGQSRLWSKALQRAAAFQRSGGARPQTLFKGGVEGAVPQLFAAFYLALGRYPN